jgi:O-antigen/teichoic acid export membrane protein
VATHSRDVAVKGWQLVHDRLVRAVGLTLACRGAVLGFGVVTSILVARVLGPEGRGASAAISSLVLLVVQFGNFGLHTANTYLVARDRARVPALLGNTLMVGLVGGSATAALVWSIRAFLPSSLSGDGVLLLAGLIAVPCLLTYTLLLNLVLGLERLGVYNTAELLFAGVSLVVIALSALTSSLIPASIPLTTAAAASLGSLLMLGTLVARVRPTVSRPVFGQSVRLGLRSYWACLAAFVTARADLLMVSTLSGADAAGYYAVSQSTAVLLLTPATVVATVLLPRLTSLGDFETRWRLAARTAMLTGVLMMPVLGLVYVLAPWVLGLMFGAEYRAAASSLRMLLPGVLFLGVETIVVQALNSQGFPLVIVGVWAAAAAVNIGLNLVAIPSAGPVGAAAVSSLTSGLLMAAMIGIIAFTRRGEIRNGARVHAEA